MYDKKITSNEIAHKRFYVNKNFELIEKCINKIALIIPKSSCTLCKRKSRIHLVGNHDYASTSLRDHNVCVKYVDCVCDWHHRHQRISRSVSFVPAAFALASTCAFSGMYAVIMNSNNDDSRRLCKAAGVHDQFLPMNPCASWISSRGFFALEMRITENKPRLLLAYITGRYANHRSSILAFFSFFKQQLTSANKTVSLRRLYKQLPPCQNGRRESASFVGKNRFEFTLC